VEVPQWEEEGVSVEFGFHRCVCPQWVVKDGPSWSEVLQLPSELGCHQVVCLPWVLGLGEKWKKQLHQ
jgi:hypothetical protein